MQINNLYQNINFGEKFRTKDVLSFIAGYPVAKDSGKPQIEEKIIKYMTGIDIKSDSFKKAVSSNETIGEIVLHAKCIEEMGKQNPVLKEADERADDIFIKVPKNQQEIKEWTNTFTKAIGEEIDIKPFKISYDVLKKEYLELLESISSISFF